MTSPFIPDLRRARSNLDKASLVFVECPCVPDLIALAGIWAGAWTKVNRLRLETALKQQMIDRGMSAEDIVTSSSGLESERGKSIELSLCQRGRRRARRRVADRHCILKREGDRYYVQSSARRCPRMNG